MERLTQPGHEYHSLEFMEDGIYIYMNRLREYEDTGLTPEQIRELKERNKEKAPEVHKNKFSDTYTCDMQKMIKKTVVLEAYVRTSYDTYSHIFQTIELEIPDDGKNWHVCGELEDD